MKRLTPLWLVVTLLACAHACTAQPSIKGENVYPPHTPIVLTASGIGAKAQCVWDVYGLDPSNVREVGNALHVWAPPGTYSVSLLVVDFDSKKIDRARYSFRVGDPGPSPPGPQPPGPTPPGPQPDKITNLRVLILYETGKLCTIKQDLVLRGQELRTYLDKVCGSDPARKDWKAWRIWDKDVDLKGATTFWASAGKQSPPSLPYLYIYDGNRLIASYPVVSPDQTMTDINKHLAPAHHTPYRKAS